MYRNWLPRRGFRALFAIVTMIAALLLSSTATAAPDGTPATADRATDSAAPVVVVTAAGLDRLLDNVGYLFQTAEREDITDLLKGLLGNVGNLKGMDRKKPFGLMVYLEAGFPPRPIPIVFVPVSSIDDLLKTLSLGPLNSHQVPDQKDRYEIVTPDRKFAMRLRQNYLFIAGSAKQLDRTLPDPAGLTRSLTSQYDLAASVNLKHVPPMARDMIRNLLLSRVASQRPRAENESDQHHQLRRAMAERHRKTADMMLKQATNLTVGWKLSRGQHTAVLEVALHAVRNSPLVKRLNSVAARPTVFAGSFSDQTVPLTAAVSWTLDPTESKLAVSLLESARDHLSAKWLKAAGPANQEVTAHVRQQLARLFEPLVQTARQRHLDAFLRFAGNPPGHFVLIGGMHLADGKKFSAALAEILKQIASLSGGKEIQSDAATLGGVVLHRIRLKRISDSQRKFFGKTASIYIGAADTTVWFAVGGEDALPALGKAIRQIARTTSVPAGKMPPFQLVLRASSWLAMSSGDRQSKPLQTLGRRAFAKGGDTLRLDYRPTDRGARLRVTLGEGFVRFLGLAIAAQYDRRGS